MPAEARRNCMTYLPRISFVHLHNGPEHGLLRAQGSICSICSFRSCTSLRSRSCSVEHIHKHVLVLPARLEVGASRGGILLQDIFGIPASSSTAEAKCIYSQLDRQTTISISSQLFISATPPHWATINEREEYDTYSVVE